MYVKNCYKNPMLTEVAHVWAQIRLNCGKRLTRKLRAASLTRKYENLGSDA